MTPSPPAEYAPLEFKPAQSIALRWLDVLQHQTSSVGTKRSQDLKKFLTDASTSTVSASSAQLAMSILTANDPSIYADMECHMQPRVARGCFVVPLLAWGFNQPWSADINIQTTIAKWLASKLSTPAQDQMELHTAVMQLAMACEERIPASAYATMASHLLKSVLQAVQVDQTFSLNPASARFLACLGPLAEKSQHASSHFPHFLNLLQSVVNTLEIGSDAAIESRNHLLSMVAQSPMSIGKKIRVLKQNPVAWNLEGVQQAIEPAWDLPETERAAHLPFLGSHLEPTVKEYLAKQNRRIIKAYCPMLYPLLELCAPPDAWTDHAQFLRLVEDFTKAAPEVLDIPPSTFDF